MPAAGDPVYASDVLRARPTIIDDQASGALGPSVTDVDLTGISIPFTTETAGATVSCTWFAQAMNNVGIGAASVSCRARISGPAAYAQASGVYSMWRSAAAATDQGTTGNQWTFTLGVAGIYTATLRVTAAANQQVNLYSSLRCIIQEQWA